MRDAAALALLRASQELETQARILRERAYAMEAAHRRPDEMRAHALKLEAESLKAYDDPQRAHEIASGLAMPPWLLKKIASSAADKRAKKLLAGRDGEMAKLARKGKTNSEIAIVFGVSTRTVARALKRVREMT